MAKRTSKEESAPAELQAATQPNFEAAISRLSTIVEELERGDLPLEASVSLFEEGILLARKAQGILDQAEKRVEHLLGFDNSGHPIVEEHDPDDA